MDIILIIIGVVCLIGGLAGCVFPGLPGPPLAYVGLLLLEFCDGVDFSLSTHLFWLALVGLVTALDFIVPMLGTKIFKGSKAGARGSLFGTIIGMFFMPWGIIVGPFLGAVIGELMGGKDSNYAIKSGIGSFLGFMLGTAAKFMLCGYFIWKFVSALI